MAFTARWLPRHVLMVVIVTAFSLLGRWQWDVSESQRGGLQNLLYAFQWWVMAAMVVYGWWRLLRDDAHPRATDAADPTSAETPAGQEVAAAGREASWARFSRRSSSKSEMIDAQLAKPDTEAAEGETDEDLARYNEYLASLNRRAERAH